MRLLTTSVAGLILALALPHSGWASQVYSFQFANSSGTATTSFQANASSQVTIQIYLDEVLTGGSTTQLGQTFANGGGLSSGGFRLTLVSSTGTPISTTITSANIAPNSGATWDGGLSAFQDPTPNKYVGNTMPTSGTPPSGTVIGGLAESYPGIGAGGAQAQQVSPTEWRVLLGSITVTTGAGNGVSTIQASVLDPGSSFDFSGDSSVDYDQGLPSLASGNFRASISVVPEPPTAASLSGLVGIGLMSWIVYEWRRTRRYARYLAENEDPWAVPPVRMAL